MAEYRRTHSKNRLAWFEGWRPLGADSAFIVWTKWLQHYNRVCTLVKVTFVVPVINCHVIIIIIITISQCAYVCLSVFVYLSVNVLQKTQVVYSSSHVTVNVACLSSWYN